MIYPFDGKEPEIGKEVHVSEQAIVIWDVKIGEAVMLTLELS